MMIEVAKRIMPFLIIFLCFVIAMSLTLVNLRRDPFIPTWQVVYRLAYGEFEDSGGDQSEEVVFFIATIVMPMIMLNLLIAIIGDIYDQLSEN
jgi:hypothetical protein